MQYNLTQRGSNLEITERSLDGATYGRLIPISALFTQCIFSTATGGAKTYSVGLFNVFTGGTVMPYTAPTDIKLDGVDAVDVSDIVNYFSDISQ